MCNGCYGQSPTVMSRIRRLSGLSLTELAALFRVSHATIGSWERSNFQDDDLLSVLAWLEEASMSHSDLASWLRQPLGRLSVTPLDLLKQRNWTAFRGELHVVRVPTPIIGPREFNRLRRDRLPWAAFEGESPADV